MLCGEDEADQQVIIAVMLTVDVVSDYHIWTYNPRFSSLPLLGRLAYM